MTRLHTLRLVFGHPNVNDALLRCFFDEKRARNTPVRRLWVEASRINAGCDIRVPMHPLGLPSNLSFGSLQSIRLRRLPLRPGKRRSKGFPLRSFDYSRGKISSMDSAKPMLDGTGKEYLTSLRLFGSEYPTATENSPIADILDWPEEQ